MDQSGAKSDPHLYQVALLLLVRFSHRTFRLEEEEALGFDPIKATIITPNSNIINPSVVPVSLSLSNSRYRIWPVSTVSWSSSLRRIFFRNFFLNLLRSGIKQPV
ncbi:hypothetical protein NH340_JMT06776 [Sarcoptes scabiei]|nr:hypothetical protein NH340_JMT06776 [Sarcoptes scabiei]